jgi:hypothetical protein
MVVAVSVSLIMLSSFATAGFLDFFKKGITGRANYADVSVNITVGNIPPNVSFVSHVGGTVSITEGGQTFTTFYFFADDQDGNTTIDVTTAVLNITNGTDPGFLVRSNNTCQQVTCSGCASTRINVSCRVDNWYWDNSGTWRVGAYIEDINGGSNYNDTYTFTVNLAAESFISILSDGTRNLSFTGVTANNVNRTSGNDPLALNNTVNNPGKPQLNATDLVGEVNTAYRIYANNFTASTLTGGNTECNISAAYVSNLTLGLYKNISDSYLPAGNNSAGQGVEQVYFCLLYVGNIISQSYSNTNWTMQLAPNS